MSSRAFRASWLRAAKPSGSPLWKHQAGYWCKKFRGQMIYFGSRWGTLDEALIEYRQFSVDPQQFIEPTTSNSQATTVEEVCNAFAHAKLKHAQRGSIAPQTYEDYKRSASKLADTLGRNTPVGELSPICFDRLIDIVSSSWGPTRIAKFVSHTKSIFVWAEKAEVINRKPNFGPDFMQPPYRARREARRHQEIYTKQEVRKLLGRADVAMTAMILLGLNGAMGNEDIAAFEFDHYNRKRKVIDYPRPKTGIERSIPLWPETVKAIDRAIRQRIQPRDESYAGRIFLTVTGRMFGGAVMDGNLVRRQSPITQAFRKLARQCSIDKTFYMFRHTFQTLADDTQDFTAVNRIMGHVLPGMRKHYVLNIPHHRLRAVVDYVHDKVLK